MTNKTAFEVKHHIGLLTLNSISWWSGTFESFAFLALNLKFPNNFGIVYLTVKSFFDIRREFLSL